MTDHLKIRLILPSGVKELSGAREFVIEEMLRLTALESDIGKSFVEVIPTPIIMQEQLELK